ncbi:MAG: hypothetical protein A2Y62_12395 [Candidatus Fischerbacteria bacterium RBG_13_37_8]|uniref:Thioredoxin domain-containing protein n=1 Tax=Candidatus Fischerbacteria bacterium RBG_13_37_8 TaxID=1817863 RepID=A0A1F5VSC6_9BACT|nr:MAG: hypothetical protein A2Y62_12395 [Candidatus Fischerbacteria bacterium RBG_13_37_8]
MNESLPDNKNTGALMKKIVTVLLFLFIAIAVISFIVTTTKKANILTKSATIATAKNSTIIVYYFHRTSRCNTCIAIENNSHEVIKNFFTKELQSQKIKFIVLNTELTENNHFVQDFNLAFNSLVVALIKDGKVLKYKNLEAVWDYWEDKEKFTQYVKENIKIFLDEI